MKTSFVLSLAALVATAVSAVPYTEGHVTKDLSLQEDMEKTELEVPAEADSNDLEVDEEESHDGTEEVDEEEVDAFGRRRRRCFRRCRRNYRYCRISD